MSRIVELSNGVYKLIANFVLAISSPVTGQVLTYDSGMWKNKFFSGNFSYNKIPASTQIIIPTNQQMLVKGEMVIEGELIIEGELCLF